MKIMSYHKCCVPGCKDNGAMHKVLHGFPNPEKDLERFNVWLHAIGSDLLCMENEKIYKSRRVCHSHFENQYICRFNRLSNIAVPTLNLQGILSSMRLQHKSKLTNLQPMKQTDVCTQSQPTLSSSADITKGPAKSQAELETDDIANDQVQPNFCQQFRSCTRIFFRALEGDHASPTADLSTSSALRSAVEVTLIKETWYTERLLCRCCHDEGFAYARLGDECSWLDQEIRTYYGVIKDCFDIELPPVQGKRHLSAICEPCALKLKDAALFKRQVSECEKIFTNMYKQDTPKRICDIKTDNEKLEPSIKETAKLVDTPTGPGVGIIDHPEHRKDHKAKIENTTHDAEVQEKFEPKRDSDDDSSDYFLSDADNEKREPFVKATAELVNTPTGPRVEIIRHPEHKKDNKAKIENTTRFKKISQQPGKLRANMASLLKHSTIIPFKSKYIDMAPQYVCIYCSELHKTFSDLRQHIEGCHNNITTPTIDNCLRSVQGLMLCADVSLIKCKQCDLVFKTIEALMEHLTVHEEFKVSDDRMLHRSVNSHIMGFDMSEDVLKCNTCGKQCVNFRAAYSHMSEHYGSFVCHICGKKLVYESSLRSHLLSHHRSVSKCKHCGQTFKTQHSMQYHIQKDHLKKTFKCPECSETFPFTNKYARTTHMVKVHGIRTPVKCDVCDREYSSVEAMKIHRYRHYRKKEYRCDVCNYVTVRKTVMMFHMNVHNNIKNYECRFCNKKFGRPYTLQCHEKIHLNDKKHLCNLCGQVFLQKGNFKKHVKSKHPDSGIDVNNL